ncbi:Uncharacterised protein [Mycobacteroides abscessus subsp. abscessus]|nr:Uncharacterised protein [Mycobacteroides abscessus subsp. abscessus]
MQPAGAVEGALVLAQLVGQPDQHPGIQPDRVVGNGPANLLLDGINARLAAHPA